MLPVRVDALSRSLDNVLERYHSAHAFDGVVVIRRHGAITYRAAVGESDRSTHRPMRVDALFPLASLTKQVTALLILQEVERGRLKLDEPLSTSLDEHLPAEAAGLTVRQLLQHTSGVPDPEADAVDGSPPTFYLRRAIGTGREEAAACLRGAFGPVGTFRYNNCDYIVLGAVLERLGGAPFAQLVHERVTARLGLPTWGLFTSSPILGIVSGYDDHDRPAPPLNLASFGAAGGLYGDATDVSRWSQALLKSELVAPETTRVMFHGDEALQHEALGSWAYSLQLPGRANPVSLVERQGTISGVRVLALFSPSDDFTITILANTERAELFDLWTEKGLPFELVQLVAR